MKLNKYILSCIINITLIFVMILLVIFLVDKENKIQACKNDIIEYKNKVYAALKAKSPSILEDLQMELESDIRYHSMISSGMTKKEADFQYIIEELQKFNGLESSKRDESFEETMTMLSLQLSCGLKIKKNVFEKHIGNPEDILLSPEGPAYVYEYYQDRGKKIVLLRFDNKEYLSAVLIDAHIIQDRPRTTDRDAFPPKTK